MENKNKFTREIIILLLPPFFNLSKFEEKISYNVDNTVTLNDLVRKSEIFDFNSDKIETSPSSLFQTIRKYDFSKLIIENILNCSIGSKSLIVNYYPSNIENADLLVSIFKENSIKVSKILIFGFSSNSDIESESFEKFEKVSSSFFICPFCFNSFKKSDTDFESKSLTCPIDKKSFSHSFSDRFIKTFNQYYFESILTLMSKSRKDFDDDWKSEIIPLIASENGDFENFFAEEILNQLGKI